MPIMNVIEKAKKLKQNVRIRYKGNEGGVTLEVKGETDTHVVIFTPRNEAICSCPYWNETGKLCSHIIAAILYLAEGNE